MVVPAAAAVLVLLVAAARLVVSLAVVRPVLVRLVAVVWRRWVLAVLGIVVRRRGRCGVVRMMWCVWMPWRSVVLR